MKDPKTGPAVFDGNALAKVPLADQPRSELLHLNCSVGHRLFHPIPCPTEQETGT